MFALFDITVDGVEVEAFSFVGLLTYIVFYVGGKLDARCYVYSDIDVGVLLGEEFVADPASCEADYEILGLVWFSWPGVCC